MEHDYVKYQALGNDYLIIDPNHGAAEPTAEAARLMCDRRRGIGADGVLYGPLPAGDGYRLKTLNADGTPCARSGNGLAIFARYLHDSGYVTTADAVVRSGTEPFPVAVLPGDDGRVRVALGTYEMSPLTLALPEEIHAGLRDMPGGRVEELSAIRIDIGNPHCVIGLDRVDDALVHLLGPVVAGHPRFPERINVELFRVLDRNSISIGIWERGAGYTTASGGGACAAACAAYELGSTGRDITVRMPGGTIDVEIGPGRRLSMVTTVHRVASGDWAEEFGRDLLAVTVRT